MMWRRGRSNIQFLRIACSRSVRFFRIPDFAEHLVSQSTRFRCVTMDVIHKEKNHKKR